jgi:hypothetical protein
MYLDDSVIDDIQAGAPTTGFRPARPSPGSGSRTITSRSSGQSAAYLDQAWGWAWLFLSALIITGGPNG